MKFEIILSGPCAYVPNRIAGTPQPASTWSAILPNIPEGRRVNDVILPPHYAVLQFPLHQFEYDHVDLEFTKRDGTRHGLILLSGHQVRIEVADPLPFAPALFELDQPTLESGMPQTEEERVSLDWVPSLDEILPGAGVVGHPRESFFRLADGLPAEGNIAAHVILNKGQLSTNSLIPMDVQAAEPRPSIWGFQAHPGHPFVARQAVAYTLALRLDPVQNRTAIRLIKTSENRTVRIKEGIEKATIEIKNREMDEIVGFSDADNPPSPIDRDFKVLYLLSGKEMDLCPLPVLFRPGGIGTRRTTCGGARFTGFSPAFSAILPYWR